MNKFENNKDIKKNQAGNENSANPATSAPAPGFRTTTGAIFEPFSWFHTSLKCDAKGEFIARTETADVRIEVMNDNAAEGAQA